MREICRDYGTSAKTVLLMTAVVVSDPNRAVVWDQVRAVQNGHTAAFEAIYRRYAGVVYAYVRRRTGDADLAEDVTSETFLRALHRIELVSDEGKDLRAWLFTIARNIITDLARTWWSRSAVLGTDVEPHAAVEPGPEVEVITRWTSAEITDYLRRLSPEQRTCLALRFFWGFSVKQTAEATHRTEEAVRALQHRAVRRLTVMLVDDEVLDSFRAS